MKIILQCSAVAAALALGGCATQFTGSAPSGDGKSIYVSGSYQGPFTPQGGRVWRCPAKTKGECEQVKVSFED